MKRVPCCVLSLVHCRNHPLLYLRAASYGMRRGLTYGGVERERFIGRAYCVFWETSHPMLCYKQYWVFFVFFHQWYLNMYTYIFANVFILEYSFWSIQKLGLYIVNRYFSVVLFYLIFIKMYPVLQAHTCVDNFPKFTVHTQTEQEQPESSVFFPHLPDPVP